MRAPGHPGHPCLLLVAALSLQRGPGSQWMPQGMGQRAAAWDGDVPGATLQCLGSGRLMTKMTRMRGKYGTGGTGRSQRGDLLQLRQAFARMQPVILLWPVEREPGSQSPQLPDGLQPLWHLQTIFSRKSILLHPWRCFSLLSEGAAHSGVCWSPRFAP